MMTPNDETPTTSINSKRQPTNQQHGRRQHSSAQTTQTLTANRTASAMMTQYPKAQNKCL